MELRHLRCFLSFSEELHFAIAAERLHIDQSPLSRAVKEVEAELGARLFVRTTRSTQLTRAGRLFLVGRYHAIATTGAASAMPLGRSRG